MEENKDKFSEALRKAQEERKKNAQKDILPIKQNYIAPVVPKKPEAEQNGIDARLVAYTDTKSSVAEQYRSFVTHLLASPEGPKLKIIAVSSSSPEEGKTLTAINSAIILAQNLEKKVLIIDANLRKPMVDVYLNKAVSKGFSDVLAGKAELSEVMSETTIKNLFCIYAGQTEVNPLELFNSIRLKEALDKLKERFDYIILDTPAIIPYADARLIGKVCDGVILVVKAEKTRREVVERSKSLLKETGAKILGVVLTNIQYHIPEYIHKHL